MWLKRALIAYVAIAAAYFAFAIYAHRDYTGTESFAPYAWKMLQVTLAWPYYLVRGYR